MSLNLGEVSIAQSVVSKVDNGKTESEQQSVTEESEVGHSLVIELEALESSSGNNQEVDDIIDVEANLDPRDDSQEFGDTFNSSSWVSFIPSGSDSTVSNDVIRGVFSLDKEVDQENNSSTSKDKTSNVDSLGQSVVNSRLEKFSVGFVGLGGLASPVDDKASTNQEDD